jgi:hypothetical protein
MSASEVIVSIPDRVLQTTARAATLLGEIKVHHPACTYATLPADYTHRLRTSIFAYAAALRESGETPDQVVKQTKFLIARTMREVDLYPGCLMDAVVTWAIEGYYRA